jgi:hypothetical protein
VGVTVVAVTSHVHAGAKVVAADCRKCLVA